MSSVVSPATQCSTHDDTQHPSSLGLGNHNVQVFPVSSKQVRSESFPRWLVICEATQHWPPIGQIINSQMGKHPSSWDCLKFVSIKATQLELVLKEIQSDFSPLDQHQEPRLHFNILWRFRVEMQDEAELGWTAGENL